MKTFTLAGREIKVKPATLFQLAELEEQGPLEQKQNNNRESNRRCTNTQWCKD